MSNNPDVGLKIYKNHGNDQVLSRIPKGAKYVLDLGCGAGDNAQILFGRGLVVDGITLSECEAIAAKPFLRNVYVYNLEQGLPNGLVGGYDVVIASHVLEHICYPEKLLADLTKQLNTDGVMIIALPNLMNWRYRLRLMLGRFEYESSGVMDNTHFRWYTFKSAAAMLERNGYVVTEKAADGNFPLYFLRKIMPGGLSSGIDKLASRMLPGVFGWQLLYVVIKKI
jgi:2-polyprenyl-3-methyl-5-hydroxy-6-metoxy-1,4-benzoquinol methylase